MTLFEKIKNGELPEEQTIFDILENGVEDNNPEIDKFIEIIKNSFSNVESTEEEILLIRVLFVLESCKNRDLAIENFIIRSLKLDVHQIFEYKEVVIKFISQIEQNRVFEILNNHILELHKEDDKRLRSFFNWCLHIIWNIEAYYSHKKWTMFYNNLKILLNQLMEQNRISSVMYVEFFTYHIMGNNFQTIDEWREFNKNITQKTAPFYKKWGENLPKPNPTKKKRKRIAFIKDRIVMNSVFQTEYSLFKILKESKEFNENYEIAVYSANYIEKSNDFEKTINMLEEIGVPYINPVYNFIEEGYYNDHYQKALKLRETLINDDIDIIIMGGVFPILDFLYLNRTAPLQIYYSHGNCAFDIEGIDKRISHFPQECKEFEWNIINVTLDKQFLIGTDGEKEVGKIIKQDYLNRYGANTVILGTIGRLVKIDNDEYIKTISEIMKQNPNTIYLACGMGNQKTIKEKLKKYNIDENRFLFLGQVKAHIYGWVIDLYLTPFKLGGQALEEYRNKIKSYVALHEQDWYQDMLKLEKQNKIPKKNELYTGEYLERLKEKGYLIEENKFAKTFLDIVHPLNKEDYLKIALKLLQDKELKDMILAEYEYVKQIDDKKNDINMIKQFLKVVDD